MTDLDCNASVCLDPSVYLNNISQNYLYRWDVLSSGNCTFSINSGECSRTVNVSFDGGGWLRVDAYLINEYGESPHPTVEYRIATNNCNNYSSVNVYPNPASNIVNIEINANAIAKARAFAETVTGGKRIKSDPAFDVRLYDGQGNLLRQSFAKGSDVQFKTANLPIGIYYIHVYDGVNEKPVIRQIVVEH